MADAVERAYRARGGVVFAGKGSQSLKRFKATSHAPIAVDSTTKRGGGPLFRKDGGSIPSGGRESHAEGGAISGGSSKPSPGRAGRKTGGGVGADCSPLTHPQTPKGPKGRKLMGEGEKTP